MFIHFRNIKFRLILLLGILSFSFVSYANDGIPTITISAPRTTINIGDPLIVEIELHFKQPIKSNENEIEKEIDIEYNSFLSIDKGDVTVYKNRLAYRFKMELQDKVGLHYKGTVVIWYDALGDKIFLDEPGEYNIRVGLSKEIFSEPVKITVKSEKKNVPDALKVFTGKEDYLFLFLGLDAYPEKRAGILERLKKVNKLSEGTTLEKWSAARLGIECWKDFQKEKDESKIDEIYKYLNKGIELPDDFPVREEALYHLGLIEARKGNKNKSETLWDELIKKYPKGEFAKKVINIRKEREGQ